MPIENEEENPYIAGFWKWWPELYKNLKVIRLTGGEPLLSKHTFKVLDWIAANPSPQLELDVNSNLGVPVKVFDRFMDYAERLVSENKIRHLKIHTSLDTFGRQGGVHPIRFELGSICEKRERISSPFTEGGHFIYEHFQRSQRGRLPWLFRLDVGIARSLPQEQTDGEFRHPPPDRPAHLSVKFSPKIIKNAFWNFCGIWNQTSCRPRPRQNLGR